MIENEIKFYTNNALVAPLAIEKILNLNDTLLLKKEKKTLIAQYFDTYELDLFKSNTIFRMRENDDFLYKLTIKRPNNSTKNDCVLSRIEINSELFNDILDRSHIESFVKIHLPEYNVSDFLSRLTISVIRTIYYIKTEFGNMEVCLDITNYFNLLNLNNHTEYQIEVEFVSSEFTEEMINKIKETILSIESIHSTKDSKYVRGLFLTGDMKAIENVHLSNDVTDIIIEMENNDSGPYDLKYTYNCMNPSLDEVFLSHREMVTDKINEQNKLWINKLKYNGFGIQELLQSTVSEYNELYSKPK